MKNSSKNSKDMVACPSVSVGAVIRDGEEYLVLYRKSFPQGLAFVAGHAEEGESPEEALLREVKEETGITVHDMNLILHENLQNPCGRGYKEHEWNVYEVLTWDGEPKLMEPKKHEFVKFMPISKIEEYVRKKDMDPAWLLILQKLGIVRL